jgi:hypothetical protein
MDVPGLMVKMLHVASVKIIPNQPLGCLTLEIVQDILFPRSDQVDALAWTWQSFDRSMARSASNMIRRMADSTDMLCLCLYGERGLIHLSLGKRAKSQSVDAN